MQRVRGEAGRRTGELQPGRALVYGFGQAGEAVARQLLARDWHVIAMDDRPSEEARVQAAALGLELHAPTSDELRDAVADVDVVLPGPGVPISHQIFTLAADAGVPAWSEFELVSRWGSPPLVAVTGTNGKTTVCTLVTEMLAASGSKVVAAGNNELPLVDALDRDLDVIVVEASSFRLELTETFRPVVGTWLNVSDDHLDWHGTREAYAAAKAKIWKNQQPGDVAVANADDAAVMDAARRAPSTVRTFSFRDDADGAFDGHTLRVHGDALLSVEEMPRAWPHDVANALAAVLTADAAGADLESCRAVLRSFRGLPHRVQLIGDAGGVRYYDDSKATTPASVVTAVSGFDSVVLIAGGRNKGLDLTELASVADRIRAVIAIGEAAPDVAAVFEGRRPVVTASSMNEAVAAARDAARAGDAVLLSPACASQDWYRNYGERGDDFARAVRELVGAA